LKGRIFAEEGPDPKQFDGLQTKEQEPVHDRFRLQEQLLPAMPEHAQTSSAREHICPQVQIQPPLLPAR